MKKNKDISTYVSFDIGHTFYFVFSTRFFREYIFNFHRFDGAAILDEFGPKMNTRQFDRYRTFSTSIDKTNRNVYSTISEVDGVNISIDTHASNKFIAKLYNKLIVIAIQIKYGYSK